MNDENYQAINANVGISTGVPRVSVVLAVYNGERYVSESIDSILNQTYKSFEFIIINDGSTDGTNRILQSYSDNSKVTILTNSINKGLTESLNFGISVAKGEYIARIDSDDISVPHRLESQVKYLDINPETWLVGSWFKWINDGESRNAPFCPVSDKPYYKWSLAFYCPFLHSSAMFRKARVEKAVGLYDPNFVYAMDYDLWSRIADVADVDIVPELLAEYREHDTSMTNTMPDISYNESIEISTRVLQSWCGYNEKIELDSELVNAIRSFWLAEYDFSTKYTVGQIIDSIQYFLLEFCASDRVPEEKKSDFISLINSDLLASYIKFNLFHSSWRRLIRPEVIFFIYRKFGLKNPLAFFFNRIASR